MRRTRSHALSPHPSHDRWPDCSVSVAVGLQDNRLELNYALTGALDRIAVPDPQPSRRGQCLWEHTCFEVFFGVRQAPEYYELNFSPSSEWDGFAFSRYRKESAQPLDIAPSQVTISRLPNRLQCHVQFCLPGDLIENAASLEVGLSTVLQDLEGHYTYWALAHPSAEPDFHDRKAFTASVA